MSNITKAEAMSLLESDDYIGPKKLDEIRKVLREAKKEEDKGSWSASGEYQDPNWSDSGCSWESSGC